jgi:hypothetical protein
LDLLREQEYPYLKSKVLRTLGDIEYEEAELSESAGMPAEAHRQFKSAFRHYVEACRESASSVYFNMQGVQMKAPHMLMRYGWMLDRLQEQLRRRPMEQMEQWAQQAIDWWNEDAQRAREFPELLQRCQILLKNARFIPRAKPTPRATVISRYPKSP